MRTIDFVLIIAVIVAAIAIAIVAVCIVLILVKIRKAVSSLGALINKVDTELDFINKVSCKAVSITEKISSPIISIASLLFYVVSCINKKKK